VQHVVVKMFSVITRNIHSYWLTTCYGLHQKTSFVSIRPHSSAHSGDSSTQRPTLLSWRSVWSFTWQGLETSSWSSSRALDRPTLQRHWICSCQPQETGHPTNPTRPWWSDTMARTGYAMTMTTTITIKVSKMTSHCMDTVEMREESESGIRK